MQIALIVAGVWSCSFIADVIPQLRYNPPWQIHAAMLGVVTGIFGSEAVKRWR